MQKILAACLEQHKLYSNLTTSGFACATKTMEALRTGAKNHNDSAEALKVCQELAADYCRRCATFIESE